MFPSLLSIEDNLLSPSTTNKNKKGDNGLPCLKPWEALKNPKGDPLLNTTKEDEDKHPIIQFTI